MSSQPTDLDAALERLYAGPYESFTQARDDLAKQARAAGNAELAAQLKKERRPPVTVWAVNQLARRRPDDVKELLRSGEELRQAQACAVRGEGAGELRDATAEQRQLVSGLVKETLAFVREAGSNGSADQQDRIEGTLLACANGPPALGEQLTAGRLEKDLPRPLFGETAALEAFASAPPQAPARGAPAHDKEEKKDAAAGAREEARARDREQREKERRIKEAEYRARDAEKALASAQRKRDLALEAARRAEESLVHATEAARKARDALTAGEAAVEQAEKESRAAEQELAALR